MFYPHQSPVHRSGMWIVPAIIIQTLKWLMINNVVLEAWWPTMMLGTIFVAMDHKPWATHGHGPNHVSGQNFALVAPTLETNDSQSLLMVIFAHSLDYRHSFNPACLIHQCSFLHFLVVVVNIFCCVKSCWRADPPDTGAEDNGANMNIKTLPGSALGSTVKCGLTDGKTVRASYKMSRPGEFTQRRWNKLNFHNWCWWCKPHGVHSVSW